MDKKNFLQTLEYERDGYPGEKFDEFWENAEKYLEGKELGGYFRYLQELRCASFKK